MAERGILNDLRGAVTAFLRWRAELAALPRAALDLSAATLSAGTLITGINSKHGPTKLELAAYDRRAIARALNDISALEQVQETPHGAFNVGDLVRRHETENGGLDDKYPFIDDLPIFRGSNTSFGQMEITPVRAMEAFLANYSSFRGVPFFTKAYAVPRSELEQTLSRAKAGDHAALAAILDILALQEDKANVTLGLTHFFDNQARVMRVGRRNLDTFLARSAGRDVLNDLNHAAEYPRVKAITVRGTHAQNYLARHLINRIEKGDSPQSAKPFFEAALADYCVNPYASFYASMQGALNIDMLLSPQRYPARRYIVNTGAPFKDSAEMLSIFLGRTVGVQELRATPIAVYREFVDRWTYSQAHSAALANYLQRINRQAEGGNVQDAHRNIMCLLIPQDGDPRNFATGSSGGYIALGTALLRAARLTEDRGLLEEVRRSYTDFLDHRDPRIFSYIEPRKFRARFGRHGVNYEDFTELFCKSFALMHLSDTIAGTATPTRYQKQMFLFFFPYRTLNGIGRSVPVYLEDWSREKE